MPEKIIYYSGSDTKRGRDLSASLGVAYLPSSGFSSPRLRNFIHKIATFIIIIFKDFKALLALRPACIIYEHGGGRLQSLVVYIYSAVFRVKLIVDCHTGVYQHNKTPRNFSIRTFTSYFSKKVVHSAQLFIAHNEETLRLKYVHKNMVVIESRVPEVKQRRLPEGQQNNKINVVFVTRFHSDEPIMEMVNATKLFTNEYHFYFTGNYKNKCDVSIIRECNNVTFTGFIPDEDYESLLSEADIIVVLTTRDYTLLYGGREAIAYNKPLVISNNDTCRNYFTKGSVLVDNNSLSIKEGILAAYSNRNVLIKEMEVLKNDKIDLWHARLHEFNMKLQEVMR